jgi:pyrroloquinoline-quinone synthase
MSLLRDELLAVMDRKAHWAYPHLTRPGLSREQLLVHFRHEYWVYVRDFPMLLARALGITPPFDDVRAGLACNLYEEQTGGLSATRGHPALFLRMMAGLGFDPNEFAAGTRAVGNGEPTRALDDRRVALQDGRRFHSAARAYRRFLRHGAFDPPWQAAVALLTIFVEGSANERAELEGRFVRPHADLAVRQHPLVKHYGCPPGAMDLVRAHAMVEGGHRQEAWRTVLLHSPVGSSAAAAVLARCERALVLWLRYRDGVAERMGLHREAA